ncbi:hypothetical protein B1A99_11865 [Cohnella sp. CIP 111063]|uniref:cache domain-containing sensor histidine kinase n=1 Tax=unclassified Cohnella TaxID=2636738 RepID=UPI000B8C5591|nr:MULTISPECIES: sensor histidine kinase [unclassified Cohnella]OXS59312.1 hypothetical protein B1A99_11865 [Cohnella sp. CIP 111063]PRX72336.1 two-component system sensor histidine kinase YesM [Cohnella sp. SGD-V74]
MLALLRKHSIRWQLIFTGLLILSILIVAVVGSYYRILHMTYERNSVYTQEMVVTIRNNIASNADTINRIMPNIAYNDVVQQYLRSTVPLTQYELHLKLEKLFVNLKSMKQGILEIVLIGTNGTGYNCMNCKEAIPYESIPERTSAYYLGIHPTPDGVSANLNSTYSKPYVFYVGVPIYDLDASAGSKLGYAIMVLDVNAIVPQFEYVSQRIAGNFYVVDRNDRIYASNGAENIGDRVSREIGRETGDGSPSTLKLSGEKYIVQTTEIPEIESAIISRFNVKDLFRGQEDVQLLIVGIFVLLIAVLFVSYLMISRNILLPLRAFMSYIHGIRAKGLDTMRKRVEVEGYAEISVMANHFNSLLDEIDDLATTILDSKTHIFELKLLKQQAELQFLKSQINPHFLYNTLETMKGIAMSRGVEEIRDISDSLSLIFRYSIKGGERVALQEEIEIIEAYLNIQQIRFAGRFRVIYEFDDASRHYPIIKMILQPLVENAIFHGIEPSMHQCLLVVGSRVEANGDLLLRVEDDGVGMEPDILAEIRQSLKQGETDKSLDVTLQRHIGIMNVHHRIRYAYGGQYGITDIHSTPEQGTRVSVLIPARGDKDVHGSTRR